MALFAPFDPLEPRMLLRARFDSEAYHALQYTMVDVAVDDALHHPDCRFASHSSERLRTRLYRLAEMHPEHRWCPECRAGVDSVLVRANEDVVDTLLYISRNLTGYLHDDGEHSLDAMIADLVDDLYQVSGLEVLEADMLAYGARDNLVTPMVAPVAEELIALVGALTSSSSGNQEFSDQQLVHATGQLEEHVSAELLAVLERLRVMGGELREAPLGPIAPTALADLARWRELAPRTLVQARLPEGVLEATEGAVGSLAQRALRTLRFNNDPGAVLVTRPLPLAGETTVVELPDDDVQRARVLETFTVLRRSASAGNAIDAAMGLET